MTERKPRKVLKIIHSLDEIPSHFDSEDDERDFWAEHELSEELWNSLPDVTDELNSVAPLTDSGSERKKAAS
jgi:hypothetical protein